MNIPMSDAEPGGALAVGSHFFEFFPQEDTARAGDARLARDLEEGQRYAIIITASGCGTVVKDYAELLKHDQQYADKAIKVSALAKDVSEILRDEDLSVLTLNQASITVAFHSPCTLQHGQKLNGVVETILRNAGFTLTEVQDSHLCCGSAGTYSILQAKLSQQLLDNKLSALQSGQPDLIATANIGCQMHMASKAELPVKHWLEVIDEHLA